MSLCHFSELSLCCFEERLCFSREWPPSSQSRSSSSRVSDGSFSFCCSSAFYFSFLRRSASSCCLLSRFCCSMTLCFCSSICLSRWSFCLWFCNSASLRSLASYYCFLAAASSASSACFRYLSFSSAISLLFLSASAAASGMDQQGVRVPVLKNICIQLPFWELDWIEVI